MAKINQSKWRSYETIENPLHYLLHLYIEFFKNS